MSTRWRVLREIGRALGTGRPRRLPSLAPRLDALEGRALLSHAARPLAARHVPIVSTSAEHANAGAVSTHNPLNEKVVGGHVAKHPRFYSEYRGPRLASLNATGADAALIPGVGYRFTGRVVGPIDTGQAAQYVFGVDRGGAKAPTNIMPPGPAAGGVPGSGGGGSGMTMGDGTSLVMFTRRPNIFVDALVTVSVGPTGNRAQVQLMQKGGGAGPATAIPPQNVRVSGNVVSVVVPPRFLPPNGFAFDQYDYAFWTRTDLAGGSGVASFAPEYNVTPVGVHRGG